MASLTETTPSSPHWEDTLYRSTTLKRVRAPFTPDGMLRRDVRTRINTEKNDPIADERSLEKAFAAAREKMIAVPDDDIKVHIEAEKFDNPPIMYLPTQSKDRYRINANRIARADPLRNTSTIADFIEISMTCLRFPDLLNLPSIEGKWNGVLFGRFFNRSNHTLHLNLISDNNRSIGINYETRLTLARQFTFWEPQLFIEHAAYFNLSPVTGQIEPFNDYVAKDPDLEEKIADRKKGVSNWIREKISTITKNLSLGEEKQTIRNYEIFEQIQQSMKYTMINDLPHLFTGQNSHERILYPPPSTIISLNGYEARLVRVATSLSAAELAQFPDFVKQMYIQGIIQLTHRKYPEQTTPYDALKPFSHATNQAALLLTLNALEKLL